MLATTADVIRAATPPPETLDWAVRAVEGARLASVTALRGGVSHANHRLRIALPSGAKADVVLRRAVRTDSVDEDAAYSPAQEIAAYGLLARSAVPAPRLIAADPDAACCDVPALLLTLSPGRPSLRPADLAAFVRGLAEALPAVHAVDPDAAAAVVPPYRPFYRRAQLAPPGWSRRPEIWTRAIGRFDAMPPISVPVFMHRDYHPGNTLWSGGRLTAIVDWTLASFGPAEFDLAHMRANLAVSYSLETADAFLAAYGDAVGQVVSYDPWWDLRAVLDWVPELPAGSRPGAALQRFETLVARAVAAIGA